MGDNTKISFVGKNKESSGHEISSPFFIHHSYHPGMELASKLHNGDNYVTWCRFMRISLNAKNKLGYIDVTLEAPSEKTNSDKFLLWQRCNDMVLSWILNSIEPDIADSVIYSSTVHKVWEDLNERFSQSNAPRIFQLRRDLSFISQEQMSMASYFTKMKKLCDELASYNVLPVCSCGVIEKHMERDERNVLMQFLMGLNESYSAIHGQILLIQPFPTLRKVYSMVTQEEKHRELGLSLPLIESAAMGIRHGQGPNNDSRTPLHCTNYNWNHHIVDTCYKLHEY